MAPFRIDRLKDEGGAVVVLFALLLIVFLSAAALAVDIGHLVVVKNELQNAADAGALAGAGQLYFRADQPPVAESEAEIGWVNPGANQSAREAAIRNTSVKVAVEVNNLTGDNTGDVQRGHWSFWERKFYPLDETAPIDIGSYTEDQLDRMDGQAGRPAFINAVRVVTHREGTPAPSFFARLLGYENFAMQAEAVAYVGFAGGSFEESVFDQPIAICEESILDENGLYSCGKGRMINSASKEDSNTGAWTNFSVGCTDNVNNSDLMGLINYPSDCDGSNPMRIPGGVGISVGGGQNDNIFSDIRNCGGFNPDLGPIRDQPWRLTLPVVDCVEGSDTMTGNITGCKKIIGAVTIDIILITRNFPQNEEQKYTDLPTRMQDWDGSSLTGKARWDSFVDHFDLEISPGIPAYDHYYAKTIYALPSCEFKEPLGGTGGSNFGVLASIPVLVKGSINYP
ncbi:MAG TPA: TadG family pilus assembly protein [Desulfuromonadales bacterium]|nr:TadG family pilus assembly protein [Desulfuromonadales bacterium]